ncbi:nostrin [Hemicordylus capensis]|uniref:nostrin n=1 Tax=Hemicordylus capensis TaxID=884348 RepID=UPI002302BD5F|nr:nostrin [Hemicordylus capensis]XP_053142992.1 nostrin [Hemicordylus capensis]XP_053142993.1 nostrin [Hemicordylus capensis]XP_053142994.1 nostrin [Hemicordylus capensis]
MTYAKGLGKLANKLTKVLDKMKANYICSAWLCVSEGMKSESDLHSNLGKAIQTEAISPTNRILEEHEKKKKALDNTVEKAADVVVSNWRQQIKAKKKLKELTRDHEALFRDTESSQQLASPKTKKKLLRNLEKSATKLTKDDEDYYKKNLAACEMRLKWETALENCHQNVLELEKERLHLLCNMLNRYSQHLSSFGQNLVVCHAKIQNTVSEADAEKDTQKLQRDMSVTIAEDKLEFLLADYYEEDSTSLIEKERRQDSIKAKVLRLQKDLEKALQDKTGLERMLKAYMDTPQFSDAKNRNDITEHLDEVTLKVSLLQANHFKLANVLAEIEQKPKPTEPWNDYISKWKEKDCMHSSVLIPCPVKVKRFEQVVSAGAASEAGTNPSSQPATVSNTKAATSLHPENSDSICGTCMSLYDYQAKREDELCLKKGDVIVIYQKEEDGWWFGSLNGKKGIFPATYVEEVSPSTHQTPTTDKETSL